MFKIKFYKTAILIFVALTVSSCDKFLELRPQDGITADNFWKNKEQLQAAVIGIYNGLNGGSELFFFGASFVQISLLQGSTLLMMKIMLSAILFFRVIQSLTGPVYTG